MIPKIAERDFNNLIRLAIKDIYPKSAKYAERLVKEVGAVATGTYAKSWELDLKGMRIYSKADYGINVELGRKPGKFPPPKAISKWLRIQNIPQRALYPILKKIADKGIDPRPIMPKLAKYFSREFSKALDRRLYNHLQSQVKTNVNIVIDI